jgi:hypothetical protein
MNFYKVVKDNVIVGACSEYDFRRWQPKHRIIVASGPDDVEVVDYGGTYYHDDWMADSGNVTYEAASVTEITEEEYNSLINQLDDGTIPDDGSLDDEVTVEEPAPDSGETETVRKTTAQLLREQIEAVARQAAGFAGSSETTFVASRNYVKGELVVIGNTMYSVTANIARGSRITPNLNVTATSLAEIFNSKETRHV